MTNVEYETKVLIKEIKKTNEYNQYQRLKKKLNLQPDLMKQINHYRRACFYLQIQPAEFLDKEVYKDVFEQYEGVLRQAVVQEFLLSEQRLCRLIKKTTASIMLSAGLDLDFLVEVETDKVQDR